MRLPQRHLLLSRTALRSDPQDQLSLAHFCELHGPTSVLCTQALAASCSACFSLQSATSPGLSDDLRATHTPAYSPLRAEGRPLSGLGGAHGVGDGDGCASCRASLPEEAVVDTLGGSVLLAKGKGDRPSLRTKEEVHACGLDHLDSSEDSYRPPAGSSSFESTGSETSCHTHQLEYVSNSSPVESETFSTLRRATIRTLSGEQLPRGQTSGPLWFGDPEAGYTIAYVFRLADTHARGRQRYYALIALAGSDSKRAIEACPLLWSCFEQIAANVVEMAEEVATRESAEDDSPPQRGHVTPVSSFLTGRALDPDGYPRRGAANVRPNGITELVGDDRFFCELHMMFVGILQDLGQVLGGLKIVPPASGGEMPEASGNSNDVSHFQSDPHDERAAVTQIDPAPRRSGEVQSKMAHYPDSLGNPGILPHRQQVKV